MKRIKSGLSVLALGLLLAPSALLAQNENKDKDKDKEVQQIVITRKGEKGNKVVIEIVGDKVTVNGKPSGEYKDGDVTVDTRRFKTYNSLVRTPRGGWSYSEDGNLYSEDA